MTYEQADLPLSVTFLGQFSQLHSPGLHEQPDSQLLISPVQPMLTRNETLTCKLIFPYRSPSWDSSHNCTPQACMSTPLCSYSSAPPHHMEEQLTCKLWKYPLPYWGSSHNHMPRICMSILHHMSMRMLSCP